MGLTPGNINLERRSVHDAASARVFGRSDRLTAKQIEDATHPISLRFSRWGHTT